jgi:hypothetical protein
MQIIFSNTIDTGSDRTMYETRFMILTGVEGLLKFSLGILSPKFARCLYSRCYVTCVVHRFRSLLSKGPNRVDVFISSSVNGSKSNLRNVVFSRF